MVEDVTEKLNQELTALAGLQDAFALLNACIFFGRETKSAALGEISEHVVARFVAGQRCLSGNKGYDVVGGNGAKVEVKSRLPGQWGDGLQFNFGKDTASADMVFCVCWKNVDGMFSIAEAYQIAVSEIPEGWKTPKQRPYFARTDLRKLRSAVM